MQTEAKILLLISQDYLDIYKYILNGSMRKKDYTAAIQKLDEVDEAIETIKPELEKKRKLHEYDVLIDHVKHINYVTSALRKVIIGLQAKADNTGKYGFFQYRKDLKSLDEAYNLFELSGNYLNKLTT